MKLDRINVEEPVEQGEVEKLSLSSLGILCMGQ